MTFMDQAAGKPKPEEAALTMIYRRAARGVVARVVPLTDPISVPAGWFDTPAAPAVAWNPAEEAILAYTPELDDVEPVKRKKAAD
jgi:hypothetical protein